MTEHKLTFDNLIEASDQSLESFGKVVAVAAPFGASNAAGIIPVMTRSDVETRAGAFASRFKAGMAEAVAG
jgi:hypothetical protein